MTEEELIKTLADYMHAKAGGIWVHREGDALPVVDSYFTVHKAAPADIGRVHALALVPVVRAANSKQIPVVPISSNDAGITRALMSFAATYEGVTLIKAMPK